MTCASECKLPYYKQYWLIALILIRSMTGMTLKVDRVSGWIYMYTGHLTNSLLPEWFRIHVYTSLVRRSKLGTVTQTACTLWCVTADLWPRLRRASAHFSQLQVQLSCDDSGLNHVHRNCRRAATNIQYGAGWKCHKSPIVYSTRWQV